MDATGFSGSKILITGASGYIGPLLSQRLHQCGGEVHAISRRQHASPAESGITWWLGDLSETDTATKLLKAIRPDFIFHLAGQANASRELNLVLPTFRSNLMSSVNLLTAAAEIGCRRFVVSGSMEEPRPEINQVAPSSPYAASKFASSAYVRMFHALYRLPVVNLRVFMVYGPGRQSLQKLIPYVILSLLRGETPRLAGGQRQIDWVYIEDVVDGFLSAALATGVEGLTIDIGSGRMIPIRTVVEKLVHLVNSDITPVYDSLLERPLEQVQEADVMGSYASIGWKPVISLEQGLRKTVDWYKQNFEKMGQSGL